MPNESVTTDPVPLTNIFTFAFKIMCGSWYKYYAPVNSSYPSPMLRSTVPKIVGPSSMVVSSCKRVEKAAETRDPANREVLLINFVV